MTILSYSGAGGPGNRTATCEATISLALFPGLQSQLTRWKAW